MAVYKVTYYRVRAKVVQRDDDSLTPEKSGHVGVRMSRLWTRSPGHGSSLGASVGKRKHRHETSLTPDGISSGNGGTHY